MVEKIIINNPLNLMSSLKIFLEIRSSIPESKDILESTIYSLEKQSVNKSVAFITIHDAHILKLCIDQFLQTHTWLWLREDFKVAVTDLHLQISHINTKNRYP